MKTRLLLLGVLMLMLAALVPGAMAQDMKFICGDLSADDCTALTTAFTNTSAAGSGAFTLSATLDIQNDDPAQAMKVDIKADGKYSGAPTEMMDMSTMTADPAAMISHITEVLKGFSGEFNLSIGLPASASAMTNGEPLTVNLILINGVGYLDFSKLPAMMTAGLEAYKIPNGWAGLDLVDILTNMGPMMASNMSGSMTASSTADLAKVEALTTKYLQYTREDDTFTGELDLAGLFSDPDFQSLTKMSGADTKKAATIIEALKDVTFEVVYTLDSDKVSEVQFMVDVPESFATAVNAANPSTSTSSSKPPKSGNFTLDLKYSDLGKAQTIAAPEGAPVAKFMDLMTMISAAQQKVMDGLNLTPTPTP